MFSEQVYRDAVLIDLETRSSVDLRTRGGRNYAAHPTTEIVCVSWLDRGDEHLWMPMMQDVPEGMKKTHIPNKVAVHLGRGVPEILVSLAKSGRPFVAHNAWGFDEIVWREKTPPEAQPLDWIDTDPLARMVGLPGGLDRIGKEIRHEGKKKEGQARLKKHHTIRTYPAPTIPSGDQIVIGSYCHDDTCGLLKTLWDYLAGYEFPEFEKAALAINRQMNAEGIAVDVDFAEAVKNLASAAAHIALLKCQELTGGKDKSPFQEEGDLRKRPKVFEWIASVGAYIGKSLNRKVVEQLIRDQEAIEAEDDPFDEISPDEDSAAVPSVVVEFLKHRFAALRITRGKADAAIQARYQGRVTEMMVHYGALTGRNAGRRVQLYNFARPHEGTPIWDLISLYEREKKLDAAPIQEILDAYHVKKGGKKADLDDAASGLLRSVLVPDTKDFFVIADYNAIELRGGALIAGADNILDFFKTGKDAYLGFAPYMYGVEITSKKDPRRQVLKVVMLGCEYGLGEASLARYAVGQGVDLEAAGLTPRQCVTAFRDAYPKLAGRRTGRQLPDGRPTYRGGIWKKLEEAAIAACDGGKVWAGKYVFFERRRDDLYMGLPSGRPVIYRNARAEDVMVDIPGIRPFKSKSVRYESPRGYRATLYGGKYLENATQASMRDVMTDAAIRLRGIGIKTRFSVYDEIIASVPTMTDAKEVVRQMSLAPTWMPDLPILVEGHTASRYSKSGPHDWEKFDYENGLLK